MSGVLPMVMEAQRLGYKEIFIPAENAAEGKFIPNIDVYAVKSLAELVNHLTRVNPLQPLPKQNILDSVERVYNVDFADVSTIFRQSESSDAILGIGENAQGHAVQALQQALESPLIERKLEGARGIILNITGAHHLSLYEVTEVSSYIYENTHDEVNIIFGVVIDPQMGETVRATLIATDFADSAVVREPQLRPQTLTQPEPQRVPNREETPADPAAKAADGGLSVPDFMNRRAQAGATAAQPSAGFNAFGGIPRFQLSTERKPN